MLDFIALEINQYKTFQNAVVKDKVSFIGFSANQYLPLAAHISKSLPSSRKKRLK